MAGTLYIAGRSGGCEQFPFRPENETEHRIMADNAWRRGVRWGTPRPGHPEGSVLNHVRDVLANVERCSPPHDARARSTLRLVALLHDTCKHQVRHGRPASSGNHHGLLARRLAERFTDDDVALELIELHEEAYACWRLLDAGRSIEAQRRSEGLIARLGDRIALFLIFYRCDAMACDKHRAAYLWFRDVCSGLDDAEERSPATAFAPRGSRP